MTALASFGPDARVVVLGAGGGLGAAFAQQLSDDANVADVITLSRATRNPSAVGLHVPIDLHDERSLERASRAIAERGAIDLVIVASGILHGDDVRPEKRLADLDPTAFADVMAVNALGPALAAKHLLKHVRKIRKTAFVALSARVGSIEDNRLGGWASYRASKAALNMLLRTIAIEYRRSRPQCVIAGLHPGTVATRLSAPFTGRVPEDRLFAPDVSVSHLLRVIDGLTESDSGGFFAWDGARIPF